MNTNKFFAVKDGAKRKILGLWQRNDSFYIQIRVLDAATGVKKAKRIRLEKATTIEEAKMAMLALKQSVRRGETVSGASGPSFKEFSKHYLETCVDKKGTTVSSEKSFLSNWQKFFGDEMRVKNISKQNVLAFRVKMTEEKYSPRTINLHVIALRNLLRLAVIENHIKNNVTDGVIQLKINHNERRLLTSQQVEAICTEALKHKRTGQLFSDYVKLMAYSGGRSSETLALKWNDIDMEKKVLTFRGENTKNSKTRHVDFNFKLEEHLKKMFEEKKSDFLFGSFRTKSSVTSFKTILNQVREALEMPFLTAHLFRHYFASKCVMSGRDFMTISKWLGHNDGGVLVGSTYGHLSREHMAEEAKKVEF